MAALAEIFAARGARLSGSDVSDTFYTDAILRSINMKVYESFEASHLSPDTDLVIFSDAYNSGSNSEMAEAERRKLPMLSFAQALGALSRLYDASGIAGVHGKTTTTAMAGSLLAALGAPMTVLTGSAVASFGDRCTLIAGDRYFVAETDEYKRHFMHFSPRRILLTSVESDHQDFYPTYESIRRAFFDYVETLPRKGLLVYCADDSGAVEVSRFAMERRPDLRFAPYGFAADGPWKILGCETAEGSTSFRIGAVEQVFELKVPGRHLVLDAVGALALVSDIVADWQDGSALTESQWQKAMEALRQFRGSRRRSEIVGEAGDVLVMDDYAHHPTALKATIAGVKAFWPSRRLIVDFMSHTYSRTIALMDEFAESLDEADCLILHDIYASAREKKMEGVSGLDLYRKVVARRPDLLELGAETAAAETEAAGAAKGSRKNFIMYAARHDDCTDSILSLVGKGDLFITMGAGDNWKLGRKLLDQLKRKEANDV